VTVDARRSPGGLWLPAPGRVCHWLLPFPLQSAGFLITLVMPLLLLVILNIITPGSAGTVPGRWVTRSSSPLRNCSVRCFSPAAQGSDGRSRASQHSEHITTWSASFNAKSNQPGKPTITAGTRAAAGRGPVTYCEAPRGCGAESRKPANLAPDASYREPSVPTTVIKMPSAIQVTASHWCRLS
jgi:hypothetical protein